MLLSIPESDSVDFTEFIGDINLIQLTSKTVLDSSLVEDMRVQPTARLKYNSVFSDQDINWKPIYLIPHTDFRYKNKNFSI